MSTESSSCECDGSTEPILCTLAGQQSQEARAAEFRKVFVHLTRTEFFGSHFRWHFDGGQALEKQLRSLAQRENECCRFFDFKVTQEGDAVVWETHAPPAARAVLEEFMRLPETLSAANDPGAMTRALRGSGLEVSEESESPDLGDE